MTAPAADAVSAPEEHAIPTRPNLQRTRGGARVELTRAGLRDLAQSGSAKAMLPRVDGDVPEIVFLNTAGGVTSGDALDYALSVGPGARAVGTTQTAERAYRATDGPGRVATRLSVGAGARLDWLPQEVILFEGADMARATEVEMAADATFLGIDAVILGRAAHGEVVTRARLDDCRTIRRGGRLLHQEHLAFGADALAEAATFGDARALATLVMVAPGVEDALGPLRARLAGEGVRAHASAWDGRLVLRLMAREAAPLRRALIGAVGALRPGPMPRVWQVEGRGTLPSAVTGA